jgi:hypothetical protein
MLLCITGSHRHRLSFMSTSFRTSTDVETFLSTLEHPFKREILAVRAIILGADSRIGEEIKWNAPSFHLAEHFATMHLRAKDGVQVILHLGAKKRDVAALEIDDPKGLLRWLAKDRATVTFGNMNDVEEREGAFTEIIRQWICFLV